MVQGSYFGEIEIIEGIDREYEVVCEGKKC